MKKSELFWQTYLNIEKSFLELSKNIFITDVRTVISGGSATEEPYSGQLDTFSPYIADLLIQTCVQIESISKELYYDLGGSKVRGDSSILFDEDCLKEIDKKWNTGQKVVLVVAPSLYLSKDENHILRPLKNAHKRGGTYWERAYQAVKHDRYNYLWKGNIKALLNALAALYLLNLYFRKDIISTSVSDVSKMDMSMGSCVFSVKPPIVGQLWYGNNPVVSDSPYIIKYRNEYYQRIKDTQEAENKALLEYLLAQPEFQEPAFQKQLEIASQSSDRVMVVWELCKYRLNKRLPQSLPFIERKNSLLASNEWRGSIFQRNHKIKQEDITEDNIEDIINEVGVCTGMEIMLRFQSLAWVKDAMTKESCIVEIE